MRILSFITDPPAVAKILQHLSSQRRDQSGADLSLNMWRLQVGWMFQ